MKFRCFGFVALAGMLSACSGIKTYPNDLPKNVDVTATTKADSVFARVKASLDIYSVDAHCGSTYQGTVALSESTTSVGLPINKPNLLAVRFDSHNYLARSSGSTDDEIFLAPRPGYQYRIEARYVDDIYSVQLMERPGRVAHWHVVSDPSVNRCRAAPAAKR